MQYQAFGPDAEVLGAAMLAFVKSIRYDHFSAVLERHGVAEIDPERWYPQQIWLDVFSDIADLDDAKTDLVSIGMRIAESAGIPPEYAGLPFVELMSHLYEASYLPNNRGKDIGVITTEVINKQHILVSFRVPYPDDFLYGVIYGTARRHLPRRTQFVVMFDDRTPRRERGGRETRVFISWR